MGRQPLSAEACRGLTLRAWEAIRRYVAHPDPLVAASNLIALVVAWNQPFYPLYVYWSVSDTVWPTFYAFFSTPFFLAVPLAARLDGRLGRAMLPLVGTANTIICTKVFGEATGTEAFLIPCALLPALFFRASEQTLALMLAALPFVVFYGLHGSYGAPFHSYTAVENARFLTLNALSAGTLTIFAGFLAVSAREDRSA